LREELGINDLVLFLGAKDQDVLPNYYAAAEMVVMPSHYESFGMVALEAMAMGRPVIASEVGGLAYLVQDGVNGYHVPTRDPEALAERIYESIAARRWVSLPDNTPSASIGPLSPDGFWPSITVYSIR